MATESKGTIMCNTCAVVECKRESDTRPAAIERAVAALRGGWVLVCSQ